jgi:CheY-like chemotaxis protein
MRKVALKRTLYAQLLFTVLGFLAMVVLSYASVNGIVRGMILDGEDAGKVQRYAAGLSGYLRANENDSLNINGLYGVIENIPGGPVYLNGLGVTVPDGYSPADRPWYTAARAAAGGIAETPPCHDAVTGEVIATFSCGIFDNEGGYLGVVCIDIRIDYIGEKAVNTALTKDGYGFLVAGDLTLLAHPNPDFIGIKMSDPSIPKTLIGDDQRLAQVIANLLGNAVKFTPENGSVSLDARFAGTEDGLCTVRISVTDTGIGITPQQEERLFLSFEQAESGTTRKYGGTGLGLAISKNIVVMMGGRIWVQSEPGKGSTFGFTVKMRQGAEKEREYLCSGVHWDNVRIMAVDDDPDILAYFREITQGFGISCDTAASGQEALGLVERSGAYHIYFVDWKMPGMDGMIFMDMQMPEMDGYEATRRIRELDIPQAKTIRIIAMTANVFREDIEKCLQAGMDNHVGKPLDFDEVLDKLRIYLPQGGNRHA